MLRKFVTIKNTSDKPQSIRDKRLSHGVLTLQPGEEFGLANDIYMDQRRRHSPWMVRVEEQSVAQAALEVRMPERIEPAYATSDLPLDAEQTQPAILEEIQAEEPVVEKTPAEETAVEEVPSGETPVEDTSPEELPGEEVPPQETPVEESPAEMTMAEIRARGKERGIKVKVGMNKEAAWALVFADEIQQQGGLQ